MIKRASKEASKSSFKRARIGAVIVKGGRVLSTGFNQKRYSKRNNRKWTSIHAEEAAILKVLSHEDGLKKLNGSIIYVSRILGDGSLGCAKPCTQCQELIDAVGIKRVIHT